MENEIARNKSWPSRREFPRYLSRLITYTSKRLSLKSGTFTSGKKKSLILRQYLVFFNIFFVRLFYYYYYYYYYLAIIPRP